MIEDSNTTQSKSQALTRAGQRASYVEPHVDVLAESAPHLREYWDLLLKRRWVVLTCFAIVFCTGAIATLKQDPVYEGKILIEINPEQPNILNFQEVLQISSTDVDSYRETQYKILQSRTLAERVVRDLRLYLYPEFYRKHRLLGLLEFDPDKIPSKSDPDPPDPSLDAFRNSVDNFQNSIDVSPVRRSNLVELSFFCRDPKLAQRIANELASAYIVQNLQVKWDETIKASKWLETQLVTLKARVEKAEESLTQYARANSILFVEERQNLASARLEQLQKAYTEAQTERIQKEAQYSLVEEGKVQDLPGFLSNKLIQDLTVRLAEAEQEYSELTARVKPDYPKAVALKKQIDTLKATLDDRKLALAQNIVEDYSSAVENEKSMAAALGQQKRAVNELAEKMIQYYILKREAESSKDLYQGLLQRMKQAQVSAGMTASNIRVVDAAREPKKPVKPRVVFNLALAAILGLGLGVGLAFFQEYLDNTLKSPDEVEALLRLPSLGVVPSISLNGDSEVVKGKLFAHSSGRGQAPHLLQTHSGVAEAFRSLRTSILLSSQPAPKMLLVTSALPSEGKTTTAVNLGAVLASLGSKVVVVDCDMRRPACHLATGVKNSPGFVQCLTGHMGLAETVLPVPGVENLSVIPCGPIPPNPAEVLSSPLTAELLQSLRSRYEYVLVDSPPLLSVSDARILSTLTDAVVLVVRSHSTPYELVRNALSLLYAAGARILGVALNDVDMRREGYGGYGRYRYVGSYGDQYGYESRPGQE
jgi:succinoglycan biosynthesis transport protein ExoP